MVSPPGRIGCAASSIGLNSRSQQAITQPAQSGYIPGKRLGMSLFPLIVHTDKTRTAMILSKRYWPEEFLTAWKGRA